MLDATVSIATEEDVPFLADVGGSMFAQSHSEAMEPDDVAAYLTEAFDPERLRRHVCRPDNVFLIAQADGERVGYARLVDGKPSALVNAAGVIELRRMYVLNRWHGTGVAALLMNEVLDAARARAKTACWLHVWERNQRAIRFYEKCGFTSVGREASPYRNSRPMALVMVRQLNQTR